MKNKFFLLWVICLILFACDHGSESNILGIAGPLDGMHSEMTLAFSPETGSARYDTGDYYWDFRLILSSHCAEPIFITGFYTITTFDS